jgi:hypothetical protein
MRPLRALAARLRRELLRRPGFTTLPTCGACQRQVQPQDFGREVCKACEAECAEASAYFQAELDATLADEPSPPAEPMFGSDDAAKPFLPQDDDAADPFAAFLRRLAKWQAHALADDNDAQLVLNEYGLAVWCGHAPADALTIAEQAVRAARGGQ